MEKPSQDLDHVNFFDEVVHEGPDTSYDDNDLSAQDQDDGSNSIHFSSPTIDHFEDELRHPQGSNGSASEDEMAATSDLNIALSEDANLDTLNTEHVQNLDTQPLRRSEGSSFFSNTYNEYVVDSKVKYGLERYEACKDQHWVEAMNKEMDALYRNDTWEITNIPKNRKSIGGKWVFKIKYKSNGELSETVYMDLPEGIEVLETDQGLCLSLRKYCLELLSDFGLLACKPSATPLEQNLSITNEPTDLDKVLDNITEYQKLIGKLIYFTHTRLDISYSGHCLSQFMHKPLRSHLKIALKVLRYLKGNPGKEIHMVKQPKASLEAFVDAGWLSVLLQERDVEWDQVLPVKLFCDSQAALKIAANPVFHERTKHLEIDLHFVREIFLSGVIETQKINTAVQPAYLFTKGLDKNQHENLVLKLGLIDVFQVKVKEEC
ncbi:ribonuclease H-like domain-containing protein [Tanacetum coccineum]